VVPGFLALAGYRLGRAVPEYPQGLVAAARVIATSAFIALIAWKLGGKSVYEHARAGTALSSHADDTYWVAVALLVVPGIVGFALGQLVDIAARIVGDQLDRLPAPPSQGDQRERGWTRTRRWALGGIASRLLHEGPSTWDRAWKQIRRAEPFAYVRVTTKSGQEIVGTVANKSRVALSPQPRDLYVEQVLRRASDGNYYPTAFGLGALITGSEIEAVEWVSHEGLLAVEQTDG
jgi:Family of unknown function (DUF6338)